MTREDILILCRAIPEQSRKNFKTVCVAGVNSRDELRRLYPVPFKPFAKNGGIPFHKRDWVNMNVKSPQKNDKRVESRKVDLESCNVSRKAPYDEIREIVRRIEKRSVKEVEESGSSLGFIKPIIKRFETEVIDTSLLEPQITLLSSNHSERLNRVKLLQESHYEFMCQDPSYCSCSRKPHRMEIHDWEVNELYRNLIRDTKDAEEIKRKMEEKFFTWMTAKEEVYFMIGTHFKWKTWMIVSLVYLPKKNFSAKSLEDYFQYTS